MAPRNFLRRSSFPILIASLLAFTLAGVCAAPMTPADPPRALRGPMAKAFLTKKLAQWQKRMELDDWKVTLELADKKVLRSGTLGNTHWDLSAKTARIRVLDASEYSATYDAAIRDMEFTLVHELVHLDFASLPRDDESRKDEERAVNRMANAMLRLERHE
ncbi:MAG: hypothetical protein ABIR70_19135 [Bryobacteraceae bacterium]